jgi:hypothetical protein
MRLGLAALAIAAIAGCVGRTGPTPSQEPSATASPLVSASATATPTATMTATPSPTAPIQPTSAGGKLCKTGGSMATGPELTITDPDVRMNLPDGWSPVELEVYAQGLRQLAESLNDPRITKMTAWQLGLIDNNVMRAAAAGTSQPSGAQAALIVSVLPVTGDLQSTVDMRLADEAANGIPSNVSELGTTDLAIGPAYCMNLLSESDLSVASMTIEYIAQPIGDSAISIGGTAPAGDTDFPDVLRSVALTLAVD